MQKVKRQARFAYGRSNKAEIKRIECPSGGMVDAGDSKSPALTGVPVRVRPWVPINPQLNQLFIKVKLRRIYLSHVLQKSMLETLFTSRSFLHLINSTFCYNCVGFFSHRVDLMLNRLQDLTCMRKYFFIGPTGCC